MLDQSVLNDLLLLSDWVLSSLDLFISKINALVVRRDLRSYLGPVSYPVLQTFTQSSRRSLASA